jgi:hypothetical protein
MILPLHILIALSSIIYTAYVFFAPSRSKLHLSYALVALTLITGTYLVILNPSHLTQACTTGLIYLGIVLTGLISAHQRLSHKAD